MKIAFELVYMIRAFKNKYIFLLSTNHLLNLSFQAVNSKRLFCSHKTGVKCLYFWYTKVIIAYLKKETEYNVYQDPK